MVRRDPKDRLHPQAEATAQHHRRAAAVETVVVCGAKQEGGCCLVGFLTRVLGYRAVARNLRESVRYHR